MDLSSTISKFDYQVRATLKLWDIDEPEDKDLLDAAEDARELMSKSKKNPITVSDSDFEKIIDILRAMITVKQLGSGTSIQFKDDSHKPWVFQNRDEVEGFFWQRYSKYLETDKSWNESLISSLNTTSNEILDMLGNPKSENPFSRRGLVIGDVQSGKTANYTTLCCKAADSGYKLIIILTGIIEELRKQTQRRLDWEFAGRDSVNQTATGVAKYGSDSQKQIYPLTTTDSDFVNKNIIPVTGINGTVLLVIKKNTHVLQSVLSWLNGQSLSNHALLLIDDEADNASINTAQSGEDPTAINSLIRQILQKFEKKSYVGITATPFANIFIDPNETKDQMLADDLFPRDFIYSLAFPDNYIGPEQIFGENGKYKSMIEPLPKGKKFDPDTEECFPQFDHPEKKFFKLKADSRIKKLPESLYDAMSYFLLVNAIRDYRGETRTHRTMMIHVTRFTSVHEQIKDRVDEWLMKVRKALREPIPDNTIDTVDRLKRVFYTFELDKKVKISWDELLSEWIPKAVSPITAGIQNALENDLHYDAHSAHGLRIIVVGGNSLSRGLTLEGLCVSYFYRNVTAYDTLMQMGRWFGYRPNYADLCKIWTTDKIAEWYGYITDTMQDLKDDLRIMERQQRTPADFGVRIKLSPSVLSITAPNKMQNAA